MIRKHAEETDENFHDIFTHEIKKNKGILTNNNDSLLMHKCKREI